MLRRKKRIFKVPVRSEVSSINRTIFDRLQKAVGFVHNLYAYFGKNETALTDYLYLQNRISTLTPKERDVVNLVTSQINDCVYCQSAHTVFGQMNGFSDKQILEIREGLASFDPKLDALAKLTAEIVENHGSALDQTKENFFAAGYTEANMIDVIMVIGDKIIGNYLHKLTNLEIDFPIADELNL